MATTKAITRRYYFVQDSNGKWRLFGTRKPGRFVIALSYMLTRAQALEQEKKFQSQ